MTTIHVTDRAEHVHAISADGAHTLLEAIRDAGMDELPALCGGCCSCSTCHIYLSPETFEALPPPEEPEVDLLEGLETTRRPTSRLACQIEITPACDGIAVTIAPEE